MNDLVIRIKVVDGEAKAELDNLNSKADTTKKQIEKPAKIKISTQAALANLRDIMLNVSMVSQAISGIARSLNEYLDAALAQKQAVTLVNNTFGAQSAAILKLASDIQSFTNYGDEQLLPLMAKLKQTYGMSAAEIQKLSPVLVDFAEANKATGMSVESAFDLMGRAVNGHTEMLGRYGIELDKTRLAQEGVAYITEFLAEKYGGTASSLADLRLQNANTWGDIKETLGDMITVIITPMLNGLKSLMEWYKKLGPAAKGWVTGLAAAIPIIGAVTTAVTVLTTAMIALKAVISPTTLIISGIVAALGIAATSYATHKIAVDEAASSQKLYNNSLQDTLDKINDMIEYQRGYSAKLDMSESQEELSATSRAIDDLLTAYNMTREDMDKTQISLPFSQEDLNRLQELQIQEGALKERIDELTKANQEYAIEKQRIDRETTLKGIELIEYQLAREQEKYAELEGMADAEVDDKLESYRRIKELENQLAREQKAQADKQKAQQKAQADELKAIRLEQMTDEEKLLVAKENYFARIKELEDNNLLTSEEASEARLQYEKKTTEQINALKKAELEQEIQLLSQKKELGVATYEEIMAAMTRYKDWALKIYGAESDEYKAALASMQAANIQFNDNRVQKWRESHQEIVSMAGTIADLYKSAMQTIFDSSKTTQEKLEAIFEAIQTRFANMIFDMTADYIEQELLKLAMKKSVEKGKQAAAAQTAAVEKVKNVSSVAEETAAEGTKLGVKVAAEEGKQAVTLQTLAVEIGANAASVASAIGSALAKVGAAIAEIASRVFSFYASLGPFGIPAAIGTIAAIIGMINSFKQVFASGGYTGDGKADEPAGVVHKGEMVFEKNITDENKKGLLGLRALLQKGYKLPEIMGNIILPEVPVPAMPQVAYASGGYVSGMQADNRQMDRILDKLDNIKRAVIMSTKVNVNGDLNLKDSRSGEDRYKATIEDQKNYDRNNV